MALRAAAQAATLATGRPTSTRSTRHSAPRRSWWSWCSCTISAACWCSSTWSSTTWATATGRRSIRSTRHPTSMTATVRARTHAGGGADARTHSSETHAAAAGPALAGCFTLNCAQDPDGLFASPPISEHSYEHCQLSGLPDLNHSGARWRCPHTRAGIAFVTPDVSNCVLCRPDRAAAHARLGAVAGEDVQARRPALRCSHQLSPGACAQHWCN